VTGPVPRSLGIGGIFSAVSVGEFRITVFLAHRPSLNKILKDFERDRLITIHYAGIDIVDVDRLRAKAQ
jgi:hypothetical protein